MKTSALIAASLLALAAAGCAKNQTSVELARICLPPEDASACKFSDTCDVQSIGLAADIDTAASDTLWLIVQVNNQTTNNADADTFRANSHDAYVEEVSVEYVAPFPIGDARQRVGPYLVPAAGSSVVSLVAVTPTSAAYIDASPLVSTTPLGIVAKVKASGHYQDQTSFETAPMEVAVDVCKGCIDPEPCVTGVVTHVCPPNFDGSIRVTQSPQSFKCEAP